MKDTTRTVGSATDDGERLGCGREARPREEARGASDQVSNEADAPVVPPPRFLVYPSVRVATIPKTGNVPPDSGANRRTT